MADGPGRAAGIGGGMQPTACAPELIIAQLAPAAGAAVLDAGSGSGEMIPLYLERGASRVTALEISGERAEALRSRYPEGGAVEVLTGDVRRLEADGRYDAAVCRVPFASRGDMRIAVSRLAAALGDGGVLAVLTSAAPGCGRDEVAKELSDAGLTVEAVEGRDGSCLLTGRRGATAYYTKDEMYALLLKEFEHFRDEGRDAYLDSVIEEFRRDHGDGSP